MDLSFLFIYLVFFSSVFLSFSMCLCVSLVNTHDSSATKRNTDLTEIVKHRIVLFFWFWLSLTCSPSVCMRVLSVSQSSSCTTTKYIHGNVFNIYSLSLFIDHRANQCVSQLFSSLLSFFSLSLFIQCGYVQLCAHARRHLLRRIWTYDSNDWNWTEFSLTDTLKQTFSKECPKLNADFSSVKRYPHK